MSALLDGSIRVSEVRAARLVGVLAHILEISERTIGKAIDEARANMRVDTALQRWWRDDLETWALGLGSLSVKEARQPVLTAAIAELIGRRLSWVSTKLASEHGGKRVDTAFAREWPAVEEDEEGQHGATTVEPPAPKGVRIAVPRVKIKNGRRGPDGKLLPAAPRPRAVPPLIEPKRVARADGTSAPTRMLKNRFRLTRLLGRGGFGEAWDAVDTLDQDRVVIKLAFTTEPLSTLIQEMKPAKKLTHPNICRYHSIEEDTDGIPFIVMEYGGRSLHDRVVDGWVPSVAESRSIVESVANALDYAHSNNVLHLDVSPQNVLMTDEGHVRLTDFGVSRIGRLVDRTRGGQTVQVSELVGRNFAYCAPEMLLNQPVGRASDQYSLALLYWVLLQRRPLSKRLPAFVPLPAVGRAANAAMARALSTDPAHRFRSCAAFVQELHR
jgi:hypothetical protein